MNRGFKAYFKEGKKAAASTLKNKNNYFRFYMFLMVKILSIVLIPFYSLVRLAQVRLVKSVKDDNDIEFTKTIKSSDTFKNCWTVYISDGFKLMYVLGNILVIILGTGVLFGIGFALEQFILTQMRFFNVMLSVFFAIPWAVVLLIYLLLLPFKYVPNAYIVDSNDEVPASKVLYYSFNALKKTGKKTLFLSYLIEFLFNGLFIATLALIAVILDLVFITELVVLITVVLSVSYIFIYPRISLIFAVFRYCLYEDVVYDQLIANKKVSGIAIKEVTTKKIPTSKEMLKEIFTNDDTEEKELARMSALLNMKNEYKVEEKSLTQSDIEAKILATPVEEFDSLNVSNIAEQVEETLVETQTEEVVEPVVEETLVETQTEEDIEPVVEETPVETQAEEVVETVVEVQAEEVTESVVEETVVETQTEEVIETVVEETVVETQTEEVIKPVVEETVVEVQTEEVIKPVVEETVLEESGELESEDESLEGSILSQDDLDQFLAGLKALESQSDPDDM